uniref:Uncharacterized protein n=1 Tax=Arundo donax TaxID=35708 RepID=A0A0A9C1W0_ARUDO
MILASCQCEFLSLFFHSSHYVTFHQFSVGIAFLQLQSVQWPCFNLYCPQIICFAKWGFQCSLLSLSPWCLLTPPTIHLLCTLLS